MNEMEGLLNKVIRAIGSFILTCIVFAIPIATAFLIKAKYDNFGIFVLVAISLAEFISVLLIIYFGSEED